MSVLLAVGVAAMAGATGRTQAPPPRIDMFVGDSRVLPLRSTRLAVGNGKVLSAAPVTGGQIGAERGRLDFDMPDPPGDIVAIEARLNELIGLDLAVTDQWITDEELLANPGLVKTMSVMPPMGQGRVRLVRIGTEASQVDLQPCGGTHVARTAEIGRVEIGKIEKKGRQNRRVSITLVD